MKKTLFFSLSLLLISLGCNSEEPTDPYLISGNQNTEISKAVPLDNKRAVPPKTWHEKPPRRPNRHAVFELPPAKGDSKAAELIIFKGFGGDAEANINRWKGQFAPPEGKKIEDVAKVTETKVGGFPATRLDVHGSYIDKVRPMAKEGIKRPNYRMIALHVEGKDNIYHIRFYGPENTVKRHEKEFNDWLNSFE